MRPNIVLIVFDTARADAFEPYGAAVGSSPAVAQLASSGMAHTRTFSTASWTAPAHGSLFAGQLPRSAGFAHVGGTTQAALQGALAGVGDQLLPEVLRRAGYATLGVSANLWVSPNTGFNRGFHRFQYLTGDRNQGLHRTDPRGRARFVLQALRARVDDGAAAIETLIREWLSNRTDDPFFLFVNLVECHSPYMPPKPWNDQSPVQRVRTALEAQRHLTFDAIWRASAGGFAVADDALARMRRNYASAIRQLDDWLARVLSLLDEVRVLPDTEVVVTSDHGENFGEGRLMGHAFSLDDRLIRVPFVASGPLELHTGPVLSLADVPRLFADVAELRDHPWGDRLSGDVAVAQFDAPVRADDARLLEGIEGMGLGADGARQLITSYACATDGTLKLLRRGATEEVFDLANDPLELVPIPVAAPSAPTGPRIRALRAALDAAEAGERPPAPSAVDGAKSPGDTAALEDQMRLLGYL